MKALIVGAAIAGVVIAGQFVMISRGKTKLAEVRADHARVMQGLAAKTNETLVNVLRMKAANDTNEAARDAKFTKEIQDAREETARLRNNPATRVRVIGATCPASPPNVPAVPGAGPVEPAAVEVDGDAKGRVLDHVAAVTEDAKKLEYLQAYAKACYEGSGLPN